MYKVEIGVAVNWRTYGRKIGFDDLIPIEGAPKESLEGSPRRDRRSSQRVEFIIDLKKIHFKPFLIEPV